MQSKWIEKLNRFIKEEMEQLIEQNHVTHFKKWYVTDLNLVAYLSEKFYRGADITKFFEEENVYNYESLEQILNKCVFFLKDVPKYQ